MAFCNNNCGCGDGCDRQGDHDGPHECAKVCDYPVIYKNFKSTLGAALAGKAIEKALAIAGGRPSQEAVLACAIGILVNRVEVLESELKCVTSDVEKIQYEWDFK